MCLRTVVVLIGQELDQELITKTLNDVLLTDSEWAQWEKVTHAILIPKWTRGSQYDDPTDYELKEEDGNEA